METAGRRQRGRVALIVCIEEPRVFAGRSPTRGEPADGRQFRTLGLAGIAVGVVAGALLSGAVYLYFAQPRDDAASQSGSVQVLGSESMRPAVTACAEDFMTRNPDADIIVKGGGSGDGVAALLHGLVDIGMTSRELSQRERDYAGGRGFEVSVFPMALDGVTVVVNRANPVATLSIDQLREIFTGKIPTGASSRGSTAKSCRLRAPRARAPRRCSANARSARKSTGPRCSGCRPTRRSSPRWRRGRERSAMPVSARFGSAATGSEPSRSPRAAASPVNRDTGDDHRRHLSIEPDALSRDRRAAARHAKAFIDFCLSPNGQALFQRAGYVSMKSAAR